MNHFTGMSFWREDPTDYGDLATATLRDLEGNLVQLVEFRAN